MTFFYFAILFWLISWAANIWLSRLRVSGFTRIAAPILFGISRHLVQEDIEGWIENPSSFHASRYLRRR